MSSEPAYIGPTLADGTPQYELIALLGEGAQGRIYRAYDRFMGRPVAIKVFSELESFAGITAPLVDDEHVVTVHTMQVDLRDEPRPFLVYEFLAGATLEAWAREHTPSTRQIAEILIGLCAGVRSLHTHGIFHRDLKPANVMMVGGAPVIIDFGIATKRDEQDRPAGTPAYMAPEQQRRQPVTALADIYGIGGIALWLFTGTTPNDPDARDAIQRVPAGLREVVRRCLRENPPDRFQSADAVRAALTAWQQHDPIPGQPRGAWRDAGRYLRRHPAAAVLLGATLVGAASGAWAWRNQRLRDTRLLESQIAEIMQMRKITMNGLVRGMVEIKALDGNTDPTIYLMLADLGQSSDINWWEFSSLFNAEGELLIADEIQRYEQDPTFSRVKLASWYRALARVQSVLHEDPTRARGSYAKARELLIMRLGESEPLVEELEAEIRAFESPATD